MKRVHLACNMLYLHQKGVGPATILESFYQLGTQRPRFYYPGDMVKSVLTADPCRIEPY